MPGWQIHLWWNSWALRIRLSSKTRIWTVPERLDDTWRNSLGSGNLICSLEMSFGKRGIFSTPAHQSSWGFFVPLLVSRNESLLNSHVCPLSDSRQHNFELQIPSGANAWRLVTRATGCYIHTLGLDLMGSPFSQRAVKGLTEPLFWAQSPVRSLSQLYISSFHICLHFSDILYK